MELGAREVLSISWERLKRTDKGRVVADLTISEGGVAVKYNVYLRGDAVELQFRSSDRGRVELAAHLLKRAGVDAEVKKECGRDRWYIEVTTDRPAAGREELRKALAEIVRAAVDKGWVDAGKVERWPKKLEEGRVLKEGWPKYNVRLKGGALMVKYETTNSGNIEREMQRLENIGLVEGVHFTVKMSEGGKAGYVSLLKEGLAYAAWLSVHGRQRELAAKFVKYILQRAKEEGEEVYEKAGKIVEEGMLRASLKLEGFEKEVEVEGKKHVVKVISGGAELEERQGGKKLLRIKITAEVDGIRSEYIITYGRYGKLNAAVGRAYASADVPDCREADAERLVAVIKALTGIKPKVYRRSDGTIEVVCGREHLEGFKRFAELADAIGKWLEETSW
jgi:hypothetical protein